jgi:homoserine dehydrogenase
MRTKHLYKDLRDLLLGYGKISDEDFDDIENRATQLRLRKKATAILVNEFDEDRETSEEYTLDELYEELKNQLDEESDAGYDVCDEEENEDLEDIIEYYNKDGD